jgi:hypothetical protein
MALPLNYAKERANIIASQAYQLRCENLRERYPSASEAVIAASVVNSLRSPKGWAFAERSAQ